MRATTALPSIRVITERLDQRPTPVWADAAVVVAGGVNGASEIANANTKPTLRQSINLSYNYSHSAADQRNIFLPLGGATETDGNSVTAGYTLGYGRISNNATLSWNRSNAATRNYFTNTANNPSATVGLNVPERPSWWLCGPAVSITACASLSISNFAGRFLSTNQTPSDTINQTISFSDFVSWRHTKHFLSLRCCDVRRVHADSIGGNNPLGQLLVYRLRDREPGGPGIWGWCRRQTSGFPAFADFPVGRLPESDGLADRVGLYKDRICCRERLRLPMCRTTSAMLAER